jgi:hypothetical protein
VTFTRSTLGPEDVTVTVRAISWTTAIGGFGFLALFVVAAVIYGNGAGRNPDEIVAYYAVPSNRLAQISGFALLTVGLALFALFVASVRASVSPDEPWSSLILGAGVAMLVCLLIANTLWASSALTSVIEPEYVIDPKTHLLFEDSGFAFLVAGGVMGATFVTATSVAMARTAGLPAWLAWLGLPVALALLAVYWYLPLFAFFAWIAVICIVGFRSTR